MTPDNRISRNRKAPAVTGAKGKNLAMISLDGLRPKRKRLPDRRAAETFEFEVAGLRYTATIGRDRDGRILEVFLQNSKPASQSDANARDSAIAASLALQFGCPLEVLRHALLRDSRSRPSTPLGAALDAIVERQS